ncbi:cytochrome c-554 [Oceanicola granulosus HTCC2516]|uniref:Cytochrome c-554 n=1 Tax=Oceanicola granulosus (strain ATCC BAA-861 / DSM 15982 / KCTC 12143 / HTCC2516) TaxID=314256 RepID=Q2CEI3_OCEGH|nr:cytochrome c [Oceanicola granulosus]EAR51014.1 cytochrome c-554 [Oceanicola granulosus HTCC2516]
MPASFRTLTAASLCAALSAGAALAQDAEAAIKARQSHMTLYAHNLGIIGAMAQGNMAYDAEMAAQAASDLNALAVLSQQAYWPEGSSNADGVETKALPAIWEDMDDFHSKMDALHEATMAMEGAAGESLEALQGQMQALGGACGGCHREYRQRDD